MAQKNSVQKVASIWAMSTNPLRYLTSSRIENLLDCWRRGQDIKIQQCFQQMMSQMPIFSICLNKRTAGVQNRKWDIIPMDDTSDSKSQAQAVKMMFDKSDTLNIDGLTEAIRTLCTAPFYGRATVKPFIDEKGDLTFKSINNCNTLQWNNRLYWNPDCDQSIDFTSEKSIIPPQLTEDEVCYILDDRPVCVPGIDIYLRQLIGESKWAEIIERQGIPQVVITPPEGTPDTALDEWNSRATALYLGGSGVLPPGSKIDLLTQGRDQDPFSIFCQHQMEVIALLALGEKLTLLGGSTGLGSNLAEIQNDEFQSLVNYDAKRISNSLTRCAVKKCVRHIFGKNVDVKCRFSFVQSDDIDQMKYIEMSERLHNIGIPIDVTKLKEITGLQMIADNISDVWTPNKATE